MSNVMLQHHMQMCDTVCTGGLCQPFLLLQRFWETQTCISARGLRLHYPAVLQNTMQVKLLTNVVTGVGLRASLSRQRLLKVAYWLTSDAAAVNRDFHLKKHVFLLSIRVKHILQPTLSSHTPDLIIIVIIYTYALPSYQAQVCATQINSLQTGLFWACLICTSASKPSQCTSKCKVTTSEPPQSELDWHAWGFAGKVNLDWLQFSLVAV